MAFVQKIRALSLCTETQARDVWDLFHLMNAYKIKDIDKEHLAQACTNACKISFSDFKDQAIAFFPADLQEQYNRKAWEMIQLKVIEYLELLQ